MTAQVAPHPDSLAQLFMAKTHPDDSLPLPWSKAHPDAG
jgi:hypothetical protein